MPDMIFISPAGGNESVIGTQAGSLCHYWRRDPALGRRPSRAWAESGVPKLELGNEGVNEGVIPSRSQKNDIGLSLAHAQVFFVKAYGYQK
jgi:hypothetical protein